MTDTSGIDRDVLAWARARVANLPEPAILLSRDYRVMATNRAYRERYRSDVRLGMDRCHEVSHRYPGPCDQHGELCPLKQCIATDAPARALHVHHGRQGPEHVDVVLDPVRNPDGTIVAFVERIRLVRTASTTPGAAGLVGRSAVFNDAVAAVSRVASSDVPVLLLGESGTGKELFARAVHEESACSHGPFIPVECSGLTESLFESELFGHEAGAFTGARSRKVGLVEAARGGTLFLDEIGDVPMALQVKLLRLLESRTFRRVGAVERLHAEFRLVCATHTDLQEAVAEGRFRLDLFYRINAFPIRVPSLRERVEGLPLLAEQFLAGTGKRLGRSAVERLEHHDFPGNVRELKNLMRRAALLCDGPLVESEHLAIRARPVAVPVPEALLPLEEVERRYLRWARDHHGGDRASLATALGVSERTLYRKLASLDGP
ncbi:MAG: sigma-54-dependent Fis family transcriptional regulator [Myxococcales bacterium]|nr:sigma-54-dependent Fis family transcriptional regulator [Myxococcales bacterium]